MAEDLVVGWRPSGARPKGASPVVIAWILPDQLGDRPGPVVIAWHPIRPRSAFTTANPAEDKYPYMFKMIVVICALGNPCVQFVEDPHRAYATQNQCLDRAEIKYQQLTATLIQEGYQLADSGYYCVRDDSI